MRRLMIALCVTLPVLPLAACAGDYGYGYGGGVYAGGPYEYDGFYDDFYGPIYDGYWGDDGGFYYRSNAHDRHFHRGDRTHFSRTESPGGHFHAIHGSMTPGHRMHMPHFSGGSHGGQSGRRPH